VGEGWAKDLQCSWSLTDVEHARGPVTMLSVHPAFTHVNIEGHTK